MSARKALVLFTLAVALGILFVLPSSLYAANGRPVHPQVPSLAAPPSQDQDQPKKTDKRPIIDDEEGEQFLLERNADFLSKRLSGDEPMSIEEGAAALVQAQAQAERLRANGAEKSPKAFGGAWLTRGPNPIIQIDRTFSAFIGVSGRIGAVTILPNGRRILGGAQGGIWVFEDDSYTWNPRTDNIGKLAIGALAYAPSNPDTVYAGMGEGELSGDSYAGAGVLKSPDGGYSWYQVSGNQLIGVSISALAVDPTDENHVYATTIRGRGGKNRVTHPTKIKYGIYESKDGGSTWKLQKGFDDEYKGGTDIVIDPQDPQKLYASFWGLGIFKTTDGGNSWTKAMNGLPADADWTAAPTRFSLAISHTQGQGATLITGFEYYTTGGTHVPSRVWKSTDEAASWTQLAAGSGADSVEDYCAQQCWYDNVVAIAPDDPNVMYALGQWNYSIESGGIYRSDDGGDTWRDIGYFTHPDFHAFAFDPNDSNHILMGNDGGVWESYDRGGRPNANDPLYATTWEDLNGVVDPGSGAVLWRTNLALTQFTGVSTYPTSPNRLWAGSQDNGTERKSSLSDTWFDIASGDGGQTLIDPETGQFLYGTYYGISPYRFDDGGSFFYSNSFITNGINTGDRSEFYIPFAMNELNPDQLFLGTYRLYRTNNARAAAASDVAWQPISDDLTTGCSGSAPNGARGCYISAIAVSNGGKGVWVGTDDGLVQYSPNGVDGANPTWINRTNDTLPNRPVQSIWVDQSNSRRAVIAYGGYSKTTPNQPGRVFRTANGGKKFVDISGNLPNAPVNSVVVDPTFSDTIYVGTDVGPFVTTDGGKTWAPLGSDFPIVAIWQLDLDPANRILAAGTHGRGAWTLNDSETAAPALVIEKSYPDTPVGPDTDLSFDITIRNIGNATATGINLKDKLPKQTKFVSASDGGSVKKGFIRWSGLSVNAGESLTLHATLHVNKNATGKLTNKNYALTFNEGSPVRGTPRPIKLSKPTATGLEPTSSFDGGRPDTSIDYALTVRNLGYLQDTFSLTSSGATFPTEIRDAACANVISQTDPLAAGATQDICVHVTIPTNAANGDKSTATITATSQNDSSVKATATVATQAVVADILLVENDNTGTTTIAPYTAALDAYGKPYDVWSVTDDPELPPNFLNAHPYTVWFTGGAWPEPLTPYGDSLLGPYLDQGGHLFVNGQDLLDQNGGTTNFVHDYLHVDWDGTESQNDISTTQVHSVSGNPVTDGIGSVDLGVIVGEYMDQVTPIAPAEAAFRDDSEEPDAVTVDTGSYKVVFLAFPFETYGNATQRADLMSRVLNWFGANSPKPAPKADTAKTQQNKKAGAKQGTNPNKQQNKKQNKKQNKQNQGN